MANWAPSEPQPCAAYGCGEEAAYDEANDEFACAAHLRPEPYFCGSNYCDDPACTGPHEERL